MHESVVLSDEVREAVERRLPVVALETTILSHGMPYPQNVSTAREVEEIVRAEGAVPATIAVLGGRIRVGLGERELEYYGSAKGILKLSRADIAYALAKGADGATTVAGTMFCARLAGIRIFATGGIGGVHRGAEASMDVSTDLEELGRTPVAVICAGAKALLDLPKTLEALETRGVPVVGFGTSDFPAFWSRSSGLPLNLRFDDPQAVGEFLRVQWGLGDTGGVLVTNPIPPQNEIPAAEMAQYIESAIAQAAAERIGGKAVTPWLLDRIYHLSHGRSLEANVALVKNNARLAARIARFT